jgi:FMN reductase
MSRKLIFIAGSPTVESRSARLLDGIAALLREGNIVTRSYSPLDFDPRVLVHANSTDPRLQSFIQDVQRSDGLVVATPVYKGTFAGSLKVLLDVIPPDALDGKATLGIATARQPAHLQGAAAGLDGIFEFFRAGNKLAPLLLPDDQIFGSQEPPELSGRALDEIRSAAGRLREALQTSR